MTSSVCRHCKLELDISPKSFANHVRWCHSSPDRNHYKKGADRKRVHVSEETRARMSAKISEHHKNGVYVKAYESAKVSRPHSDESKDKIRKAALASDHRRLRKKMHLYNNVKMDSTWEVSLAMQLDKTGVLWERPGPIKWMDENNVTHNYFPDFYIPEYDVYLDPKNPYAFERQKAKIDCLLDQYDNIFFLVDKFFTCNFRLEMLKSGNRVLKAEHIDK